MILTIMPIKEEDYVNLVYAMQLSGFCLFFSPDFVGIRTKHQNPTSSNHSSFKISLQHAFPSLCAYLHTNHALSFFPNNDNMASLCNRNYLSSLTLQIHLRS